MGLGQSCCHVHMSVVVQIHVSHELAQLWITGFLLVTTGTPGNHTDKLHIVPQHVIVISPVSLQPHGAAVDRTLLGCSVLLVTG